MWRSFFAHPDYSTEFDQTTTIFQCNHPHIQCGQCPSHYDDWKSSMWHVNYLSLSEDTTVLRTMLCRWKSILKEVSNESDWVTMIRSPSDPMSSWPDIPPVGSINHVNSVVPYISRDISRYQNDSRGIRSQWSLLGTTKTCKFDWIVTRSWLCDVRERFDSGGSKARHWCTSQVDTTGGLGRSVCTVSYYMPLKRKENPR